MELSNNIAYLRKKIGLSQEGLAEKLNLSRQAIAKWENGSSEPSISTLIELSNLFNLSIDDLLLKNYCTSENSSLQKVKDSSLKIVEMSGYNISDVLINVAIPAEIDRSILYASNFNGIIRYETNISYGTKPVANHDSLKRLFYKIASEPGSEPDWYMITNLSQSEMKPFLDWLHENYKDIGEIETLYLFYEENSDYDFQNDNEDIHVFNYNPVAGDVENEMNYIKRFVKMQEYAGPFPPTTLYEKIKEELPGIDLPYWFMTGDFSK